MPNRLHRVATFLVLSATAAVAATPTPSPTLASTPGASAPPAPRLRLPDLARPERYKAELTVDPTKETFAGTIDIDLIARVPMPLLWLNANDLTVTRVVATSAAGGATRSAGTVVSVVKNFVGVAFDRPLPVGASRVHLEYTGKLSSLDSSGASRQKEGGEWYVYTHFEPIDARRVFPCFDEPSYKVPWQLTLSVRSTDKALSNTPIVAETDAGGGYRKVRFAETRPLPSYLIAWAVGPFDIVDAGASPRSKTPVRIITPRGLAAQARWAAESSRIILSHLEDYFGQSYPFEKLDCIAVPQFGGAMENPGLVTFSSALILVRPSDESLQTRRAYAHVATHEFAHMWFGDLVTTAWWDDLWLNEAFASWMTPKIIEAWQPTWGTAEARVGNRGGAMAADSLLSARKIRQPIDSDDDMQGAFDGITYAKGAAVITMFERWVGAQRFQEGVRRYMKDHAYGNATATDFLAAISRAFNQDIAPSFSTFLDRPGVPLVQADLRCDAGKTPALRLSQTRYLPVSLETNGAAGVAGAATDVAAQPWQIPICARYGTGTTSSRACMLLDHATGELPLPGACPTWVLPNEGESGYFRVLLGKDLYARLFEGLGGDGGAITTPDGRGPRAGGAQLTIPEQLGVVSDLTALAHAGKLSYADALSLVPALARSPNRHAVQSAIGLVAGLREAELVGEQQRPAYARFIRDHFGARAHALGWKPRAGEDDDQRLLRVGLLPLVADQGEDAGLVAEAQSLAAAWNKDHAAVDPEMVDAVLAIAARHGDRALFDAWHARARSETDQRERRRLLGAMASFRDPEIVKTAMALVLGDEFEARESMRLVWGATSSARTRPLALAFVETHFDKLVVKLPRDAASGFPGVGGGLCDAAHVAEVESFFKERSTRFIGGPRRLAQTLEGMRICAAEKQLQAPNIDRFFTALPR